jgi:N-methylhydantoinase B
VLSSAIPNNEGVFRAIEVMAPPGTIANAVLPASCAARGLTGFRMVDTMFGALAQMVPDKVMAASDGGNVGVSIGGWTRDRKPFIWVDFSCAAWGGRPWADGLDGNSNIFANQSSQSVEITEAEQPFEITRYELIQDGGGPGKFRGGCSYRRHFRILAEEATLQVRSDRRRILPYGLYGGGPGRPSMLWIERDGATRELPSKPTMTVRNGDVFREEVAGAGGWGDPLERDPALVLRDVRNEFVSLASASEDYGVVIDPQLWVVETAATEARRREIREARGWTRAPTILRERPRPTLRTAAE